MAFPALRGFKIMEGYGYDVFREYSGEGLVIVRKSQKSQFLD